MIYKIFYNLYESVRNFNISIYFVVCTDVGEKIALSRRVDKHWRLIGWGKIRNGVRVNPTVQE